jgi:hypothetical protein
MSATGLPGTIGNCVRRRGPLFGEAILPLEKFQGVQFPEIAANIQPMIEQNEQIAESSTKVTAMTTIPKRHPNLEAKQPIEDTDTLWRYVPLKTLFCYLSGSIFIPSLQKLQEGDPFEAEALFDQGYFNYAIREQHGNQAEEIFRFLREEGNGPAMETHDASSSGLGKRPAEVYFGFLRKTRYAWCWFCRERESALMWNTYGRHGAAIRTTVRKLRTFLESCGRDFRYGRMLYVDVLRNETTCLHPQKPEDRPFLLEPCFLKRSEYEDENEVRFVTTTADLDAGVFLKAEGPDTSIQSDWIEHISLWPGLHSSEERALTAAVTQLRSSERRALTGAVTQLQPAVSCCRSELLSGQKQRSADQKGQGGWSDAFDEQVSEKSWRDGTDGVPAALKTLLV